MHPYPFRGDGSDEEAPQALLELDESKSYLEPHDVMHTATTEKKVDADFFNGFDDDFDETDMRRIQ